MLMPAACYRHEDLLILTCAIEWGTDIPFHLRRSPFTETQARLTSYVSSSLQLISRVQSCSLGSLRQDFGSGAPVELEVVANNGGG